MRLDVVFRIIEHLVKDMFVHSSVYDLVHSSFHSSGDCSGGGGGGLTYITDRDARQNFQKQPLKVTILGVAPANFIP